MSWSNIKQLKSYKGNSFTYDGAGMRLSKNSIQYTYDGDRLLKEDRNGTPIYYYYGVDGIAAFEYNGEYYYYVKAVPKIVVSTPEKTVKRINESTEQTEIISEDTYDAAAQIVYVGVQRRD